MRPHFSYYYEELRKLQTVLAYLTLFYRYLAESYANKHAHMAKNDHPPCDGTVNDAFAQQGSVSFDTF